MSDLKSNNLINEKSPYLLQHAYNPVDWYPWGDAAFEKAKTEDKPIFLSIGYSTCHWCHVMEKESFEDSTIAALMNEVFVSIKVDREERPDIDNIYMQVCQLMTGHGGWPLTILLTPGKKPFFAATYLPKNSIGGRIGMIELIKRVDELWKTKREDVELSAGQITDRLVTINLSASGEDLDTSVTDSAFKYFEEKFDPQFGGFGNAPKFPSPHNLLFLLRYWKRSGNPEALEMVEKTLTEMRRGGIYDQIGFGFHRYSTDRNWLLPHFEKMLYDQAMLSIAFTETYQATGKENYKNTSEEIFEYILRDMKFPEGGFYSAEDADSDGEEGKFYVWTEKELRDLLGDDDYKIFSEIFHTESNGNFLDQALQQKTGSNILYLTSSKTELADHLNISVNELEEKIKNFQVRLFNTREKRVHPHKDDKILTDWNGLAIAALSIGAKTFNNSKYAAAAVEAVEFIKNNLLTDDGILLHRYRDKEASINGNLDDYAFMIWGLIELYEATFNPDHLEFALKLNKKMLKEFWDNINGGFYFTPQNGEKLIVRTKESYDAAIPSGNSVAALNLIRLSRITGNTDLENKSNQIFSAFAGNIKQQPGGFGMMLSAIDFFYGGSYEIILTGSDKIVKQFAESLNKKFIPNKIVLAITHADTKKISKIAPYTESYHDSIDHGAAYVCKNFVCNLPSATPKEMMSLIE